MLIYTAILVLHQSAYRISKNVNLKGHPSTTDSCSPEGPSWRLKGWRKPVTPLRDVSEQQEGHFSVNAVWVWLPITNSLIHKPNLRWSNSKKHTRPLPSAGTTATTTATVKRKNKNNLLVQPSRSMFVV